MIRLLKELLKSLAEYLFCVYVPVITTFFFALFMYHFFPDFHRGLILLFCIGMIALVSYIWR